MSAYATIQEAIEAASMAEERADGHRSLRAGFLRGARYWRAAGDTERATAAVVGARQEHEAVKAAMCRVRAADAWREAQGRISA